MGPEIDPEVAFTIRIGSGIKFDFGISLRIGVNVLCSEDECISSRQELKFTSCLLLFYL